MSQSGTLSSSNSSINMLSILFQWASNYLEAAALLQSKRNSTKKRFELLVKRISSWRTHLKATKSIWVYSTHSPVYQCFFFAKTNQWHVFIAFFNIKLLNYSFYCFCLKNPPQFWNKHTFSCLNIFRFSQRLMNIIYISDGLKSKFIFSLWSGDKTAMIITQTRHATANACYSSKKLNSFKV